MADQAYQAKPAMLTPEQLRTARRWLDAHWTRRDCPFHGATKWQIETALAEVVSYAPNPARQRAAVFPFLVVLCTTCGYSVLVNALTAGILDMAVVAAGEDL